jgi:hypothetical protein
MHDRSRTNSRHLATLVALPVAGLLALTACSSAPDGDGGRAGLPFDAGAGEQMPAEEQPPADEGMPAQEEETARSEASDADSADGLDAGQAAPVAAQAHLIRTATVVIATEDVAAAYAGAVERAAALGGYVSGEDTEREASGDEVSHVTLKVPADRYEELLADVSALGELEYRSVATEDVTDQVVDVESRIATQEESVARIRELLDQATSIDDIVGIEAELSTRQADLESLRSQYESLRDRTGLATIELELRQPDSAPVQDTRNDSSDPSVSGAVSGGWDAFVTALLWTAAVLGAALPFLGLLALLLLGWRLARGRYPGLSGRGGADGTAP